MAVKAQKSETVKTRGNSTRQQVGWDANSEMGLALLKLTHAFHPEYKGAPWSQLDQNAVARDVISEAVSFILSDGKKREVLLTTITKA